MLESDAARSKLGPTGIGGVLRNNSGHVLAIFSKDVGIMNLIRRRFWQS